MVVLGFFGGDYFRCFRLFLLLLQKLALACSVVWVLYTVSKPAKWD